MQKREWVYHGRIKQHLVEVLHAVEAEKIIIRLNGAVLFEEILPRGETKSFRFFIDEELCEVKVATQQPHKHYTYELIAHEFSTSQFGKRQKWRDRWQKIGFGVAIAAILLLFVVPVAYYTWKQQHASSDFRAGGISTPAQVIRIEAQPRNTPPDSLPLVRVRLYYTYKVQQKPITAETTMWLLYQRDTLFAPTGMPLFKGDTFEVLFVAQNPEQSQLRLEHPTDEQLGRYWLMARDKCLQNHDPLPMNTDKAQYCDCLLYDLVNAYDLVAFAHFYHQFDPPTPRTRYHRLAYEQWIGQRDLRILQSNCAANPLRK